MRSTNKQEGLFKIRANAIDIYSSCPNKIKYGELSLNEKIDTDLSIFKFVVQKTLLYQSKYLKIPKWKNLLDWNNLARNNLLSNLNEDALNPINILNRLHFWFYKIYKQEPFINSLPIINPKLYCSLSDNLFLEDSFDFILVQNNNICIPCDIISVNNIDNLKVGMYYNKASTHLKLMAFEQISQYLPSLYYFLAIGPNSIKLLPIRIYPEKFLRIKNSLKVLINGISNKSYYPSISSQCDTCKFVNICSIS